MTKTIDLTAAPYFDDYNEKKGFHKILFRPGRSVQARELTQLQTIIQKQVARLGSHFFQKTALVFPKTSMGCKYDVSSYFLKIEPSTSSLTASEANIKEYWLNKKIFVVDNGADHPGGVEGTVIGYDVQLGSSAGASTLPNAVRLFVTLDKGSEKRTGFVRGDTIATELKNENGAVISTITANIEDKANAVGRIASIEIPESIYFYKDYFVLVDTQYFFITPTDPENDSSWNGAPTGELGIELKESIVTFEDDGTLLDNANGATNFGAPGADRLRIEGVLTRKKLNYGDSGNEQNFIKLLTVVDGIITNAHQLETDPYADPFKSYLATRTEEESGDYTLTPFLATAQELIASDNTGSYREEELFFPYDADDTASEISAKKLAGEFATNVFNLPLNADGTTKVSKTKISGQDYYFPGTSWDAVGDVTSFKSLCENRIGVTLEAATAYVKGYRIELLSKRKIALERSRTSDFISNAILQAPMTSFMYVTDVLGFPPISDTATGGTKSYGRVSLYSQIIQDGNKPNESYKVGTARVYALEYFYGALGRDSAVFKLGVFDVELVSGKNFSDVRSLYGSGFATGDFSANLSLVDSKITPKLQFQGLVSYVPSVSIKPVSPATVGPITSYTSSTKNITIEATLARKNTTGYDTNIKLDEWYADDYYSVGTAVSVTYTYSSSGSTVTATEIKIITKVSFSQTADTYTPSGGTQQTGTKETLVITLDSALAQTPTGISDVKTVYKIRGTGTSWRSKPGESIKKGDQVAIGSGENTSIYTVFSDPANDNELNLTPDPSVVANSPWKSENGSIIQYLLSEPIQEESLGNTGLIFKMSHNSIRTIRGGSKNSPNDAIKSLSYISRRIHTENVTNATAGTKITISAGTNQSFIAGVSGYLVCDPEGYYYNVALSGSTLKESVALSLDASAGTANFTLPEKNPYTNLAPVAGTYSFILPVKIAAAGTQEGTKTLIKGGFTSGVYNTNGFAVTSGADNKIISLGKADVFRITRIVESPNDTLEPQNTQTLTGGHKDITGAYLLDDGQTDFYYGIAKVYLRPGANKPTGRVRIEFDYFTHSGDYFTVDSYPWKSNGATAAQIGYNDIPTYYSPKYGKFDLNSCIDFRPVCLTPVPNADGSVKFDRYKELPFQDISLSYHVYESRKDKLYIDTKGNIKIKYGTPGLISRLPPDPIDGLTLYEIEHLPYTANPASCLLKMRDNRRYTMRDIGKLEDRIKNLEYYTSLSMLESDTKDLVVKDALGQDKFKHGFMTDNFENPSVANLADPDFSAALDTIRRELKPIIAENEIVLRENLTSTTSVGRHAERLGKSAPYQLTNTLFTLPYANESWLEQPICSRVINVNPYNTQSFIGGVEITPWTDTWRETEMAEPLEVFDDSAYRTASRNFNSNGESILWLGTRQEWTGLDIETDRQSKVLQAGSHGWPIKNGEFKGADGKPIHGTGRAQKGDKVQVPPGYRNSGDVVEYGRKGSVEYTDVHTMTMKGQSYDEGIKSKLLDLGYSSPVSMGTRIKNISAATYIRESRIEFTGKGFLPNSKMYAFFDNQNVTAYCHPAPGNGNRGENPSNVLVGPLTNSTIGFGLSHVEFSGQLLVLPTVTKSGFLYSVDASNRSLGGVVYEDISSVDNSVLSGKVRIAYDNSTSPATYYLQGEIPAGSQDYNTRFTRELVRGSVVCLEQSYANTHNVEVQCIDDPQNDGLVKIAQPYMAPTTTINASAATQPFCNAFDKTEYLERKYVGKYVDIKGSSQATRNFVDNRVSSIEYNTQTLSTPTFQSTLRLNFTGLNLPTGTETSSGLTITIKDERSSQAPAPGGDTFLLCDSTGSVKGTFCIPDPKVSTNPKFKTGDVYFRLTNSETNANTSNVSRADAKYSATGWIDEKQDTLYSTKQFNVSQETIQANRKDISLSDKFETFGGVCPMDPLAQSFTVLEKEGIFITAVDIFFYSKDPNLPIRFQIRPLDDGGNPSVMLMYEKIIDSKDVVVNKFDLASQKMKIIGADPTSENAVEGFNRPPWNNDTATQARRGNLHKVYSKNYLDNYDSSPWSVTAPQNTGAWFSYTKIDGVPNPSGDMIPTRVVLDYPIYLAGNNRNYCFVLLTDSVQGPGTQAEALENTYQVYMAQTGIASAGKNESATPIHLLKPLEKGEDDINYVLGTNTRLQNIPKSTGMLFKSINGISWESDQYADLKFNIHKATFNNSKNGEIEFANVDLEDRKLMANPFQTVAGSSLVRVWHRNHNIPDSGWVMFTGVSEDANLNGIPYHIFCNKPHQIESPTLDSYVISLHTKYAATSTGFVGGRRARASNNIRFEEFTLSANPVILPSTEITWRIEATTARTAFDPKSVAYQPISPFNFTLNTDTHMPLSAQVYSKLSETKNLTDAKSLRIYATLSSKSPNISPVLNLERMSMIGKAVRLDNPVGVGTTYNINHDIFDSYQCLPTTLNPVVPTAAATLASPTKGLKDGILYFSDTDNKLTGSSFSSVGVEIQCTSGDALFTVELNIGDTIKHPSSTNTAKVVEIINNNKLITDKELGLASLGESSLLYNPPNLRIKTKDASAAAHLSKLDVGKYLSVKGTTQYTSSGNTYSRDFENKKILKVKYNSDAVENDAELNGPCYCEIEVEHNLPTHIPAGPELFGNSANGVYVKQLDNFIDEIAYTGGSVASKYISKPMRLQNSANCLKVMFDGCRPEFSDIDLYYRTSSQTDAEALTNKNWVKLEYSIEKNGTLEYVTPGNNSNSDSFSAYEANALAITPFSMAQVKIVLRGGHSVSYPKIKNLRLIALEE